MAMGTENDHPSINLKNASGGGGLGLVRVVESVSWTVSNPIESPMVQMHTGPALDKEDARGCNGAAWNRRRNRIFRK